MKVKEYFKKGQEVWIITGQGIKKGSYFRLESTRDGVNNRWVYIKDLVDYKNEYGVTAYYQTFPESKVFSTREAAVDFLRTGKSEVLTAVAEHESVFEAGDIGYKIGKNGVESERFTSVEWRVGEFEYHTNAGGCAVYPERDARWFHTREEAVEALIAM